MTSAQPVSQPSHRGAPPMNNGQQAVSPPPPSREQLKSWWTKLGRKKEKVNEQVPLNPGIFGVPLSESILYANVAISLTNEQGDSFIYGYVPIVVAKCGVFLKEKATDVEGIFRLSGSAKRIKDLQNVFNSPERYGKGLDWTGYTVHDAANILRRYLNQLPEPIVPLQYYEQFRDPLRAYQAKVGSAAQAQAMENQEHTRAVVAYQKLITELPALNRQLLLYILDLLAVFASKSDLNRMTAQNLAAIFQPGIISHPSHDMAPNEYRLSQDVLIFLIENQDNFLIGMTGTAMDEKTKDEVKSGTPSIRTPKTAIGRSASTASAGADSLRRTGTGGPRRNGSMSSRHSRERGSPGVSSPAAPASPSGLPGSTGGAAGGLGRSNTLPSNRSPPLAGPRFQRMTDASPSNTPTTNPTIFSGRTGPGIGEEDEDNQTSFPAMPGDDTGRSDPAVQTNEVLGDLVSETHEHPSNALPAASPAPIYGAELATSQQPLGNESNTSGNDPVTPTVQEAAQATPTSGKQNTRERKISNLLSISPMFGPSDHNRDPNQRQPRKLQKRRIPGSHNESAQSSQASLNADEAGLSYTPVQNPQNPPQETFGLVDNQAPALSNAGNTSRLEQAHTNLSPISPTSQDARTGNRGLMPPHSPTPSAHSRGSATDPSDLEALDERQNFRLSGVKHDSPLAPPPTIGQLPGARTSNSSLGSHRPRKSFTGDSQLTQTSAADTYSTGQPSFVHISSRESAEMLKDATVEPEKKGLFGRFRAKISSSRDQHDGDRAKSPPRVQGDHTNSRSSLSAFTHEHFNARGRSFDRPRGDSISNLPENDQAQRVEAQRQTSLQTYVQPPTPTPGPAGMSETSRGVPAAPLQNIPILPYQPPAHSQTFPIANPATVPSAMVSPPWMPANMPNPASQEPTRSTETNDGFTAEPVMSSALSRPPNPDDSEQKIDQASDEIRLPTVSGLGATTSEQKTASYPQVESTASSKSASETQQHIQPTQEGPRL